ncbi:ATP synthase subunit C lysine N-methyltransferase [Ctenodactylus gundi]
MERGEGHQQCACASCVPDCLLRALPPATQFIFMTCDPHFADEEMVPQQGEAMWGHTDSASQDTLGGESPPGCILPASLEASSLKKSSWGFLLTGVVSGAVVALYAIATPFLTPAFRKVCLPFVPATSKQIENVVKMLRHRRGSLVDIGSGDGRIVIAAAKEGFEAVGYELNPWLVWYSRYHAWREGVHGSAKFYISDLWKVTFSQYSNVIIFGVPQMMPQLEKKLELELEDDARVIACRFPFPHWSPDHVTGEGVDTVWAYDASTFKGAHKTKYKRFGRDEAVFQIAVLVHHCWKTACTMGCQAPLTDLPEFHVCLGSIDAAFGDTGVSHSADDTQPPHQQEAAVAAFHSDIAKQGSQNMRGGVQRPEDESIRTPAVFRILRRVGVDSILEG